MQFYETLGRQTASDRDYLLSAPVIRRTLAGEISHELYIAFLTQAFHHVRHTVPLLMAVGARLSPRHEWLRGRIMHYLEEEQGHDRWILDDIRAAGGDASAVEHGPPGVATDVMVAYAYDTVMRRNPVGFFGMVFVLEGTSVALALRASDQIQATLKLPSRALIYLRSHGQLDQQHVQHLADILNSLDTQDDREAVAQCARAMYWLYGNVFRSLDCTATQVGAARMIA
jgi:pyrroloquinoline quinone (PQQ) biosynthesis protein C